MVQTTRINSLILIVLTEYYALACARINYCTGTVFYLYIINEGGSKVC